MIRRPPRSTPLSLHDALPIYQISGAPTSATATPSTICNGGSSTLALVGGGLGTGEVIHWYTVSCGGTSVGTGNNFSLNPITTPPYYGPYEDRPPCSVNTICQQVTVTVN